MASRSFFLVQSLLDDEVGARPSRRDSKLGQTTFLVLKSYLAKRIVKFITDWLDESS
jgi:hypothetical protein